MRKIPELAKSINTLIALAIMYVFVSVYVFIAHPWNQPILFIALLGLIGVVTIITILTGRTVDPDIFLSRVKYSLTAISILLIASWMIPINAQKKAVAVITNTIPKEIKYDASNIDSIEFFDKITGEPKIWYWLSGATGKYELYTDKGFHRQTGEQLQPATPQIVNEIKKYVIKQKENQELENMRIEKQKKEEDRLRLEKEKSELERRQAEEKQRQERIAQEELERQKKIWAEAEELKPKVPLIIPQLVPGEQVEKESLTPDIEYHLIPANSNILIRVEEDINTDKHKSGRIFRGNLYEPIKTLNETIIEKDSRAIILAELITKGNSHHSAMLKLVLTGLIRNNTIIDTETSAWSKIDDPASTGEKVAKGAATTAAGAIIGGLLGGGKGAAIGGAIGAAGGTAATMADKTKVEIKKGTILQFTLSKEVLIPK